MTRKRKLSYFLVFIFLYLILFIQGTPVWAVANDILSWEYYNANDDADVEVYGANWYCQTFTTNISHSVEYIKLKLYQEGTPGILTVAIQAVTDSGEPDGVDLTSGVINGSILSSASPGNWNQINVDSFYLEGGTKYAIVVRGTGQNAANNIHWRYDNTGPTLKGGEYGSSSNGGGAWTMDNTKDFMFEVWGLTTVYVEDAKVFQNYIEEGDWLVVAEYGLFYEPYYPRYNPKNYFLLQLVNDVTGDVEAQLPVPQWGFRPGSIYINADDAESLEWQGNYSVRLNGTFAPYPNYSDEIRGADWVGGNLLLLDDWCLILAHEMEDYYGTSPPEECCTIFSSVAGRDILNEEGGAIFIVGIPYLNVIRQAIFAVSITEPEYESTNFSWAYVESLDWEATVGPEIANASTEFAYYWFTIERPTGGRIALGLIFFIMFVFMAGLGVPPGHHSQGMILGLPLIIAGAWLNVVPWAILGVCVLLLLLLLVKAFWWGGT